MSFGVEGGITDVLSTLRPALREFPDLQQPRLLDHAQLLLALKVSPLAAPAVLQVVRRAHSTPYPPHWSEELDQASGALYFYHSLRDEAVWHHPLIHVFQEVFELVEHCTAERISAEELSERIESALRTAQEHAAADLERWVGPLGGDDGQDAYYFNHITGESSWEDPRERWQYELQVRYDLLVGYLVSEERGEVRAQGFQDANLTATLTSLASTMNSFVSTVSQQLPSAVPASTDHQATGPPATPRFGGLKLPPKATGGAGTPLFTMSPQHHLADRIANPGPNPAEARGMLLPTPAIPPLPSGVVPPPPPPGAAPRWQQ